MENKFANSTILLEIQDNLAIITLNRPEKLNALDQLMLDQLDLISGELDRAREVRVVILTGAGERAFCVGADIKAWAALSPLEMGSWWVRNGHRVFDRLARLRQPLIAALNGFTFGGGLELALTADIRLAAAEAELALPEVKLGTVPGWAGTQRLPALIGPARAKQLIFSGARLNALTAEKWGLVNETVPRAELMTRAKALATEIAANAPISVQTAKQLVDCASGPAGVALEALAGSLTAYTADLQEGLTAYREKRPGIFSGT